MLIHGDMLQHLVEKIIDDIGYNINIIDTNGYIIASGNKSRLGTYHKIGQMAAKEERRIDIKKSQECVYEGVKAGVNQPFYYNGKIAGIIGITGEPFKIDEFVKVVKSMIELMFEQEMLKQKMYHRKSNKAFFINTLFNINSEEEKSAALNWGQKLGYDFSKSRAVMLLDLRNIIHHPSNIEAYMNKDMVRENIRKFIKDTEGHTNQDVSSYISMNKIIILKVSKIDEGDIPLLEHAQRIVKVLKENFMGELLIGLGSVYKDIEKLNESYKEAEAALDLLKSGVNKYENSQIKSINDCLLSYCCSKMPNEIMKHFFQPFYEKIQHNDFYIETIIALSTCNMNIKQTAKVLFLHRNTVVSRFYKLKDILGLDPINSKDQRHFWDLFAIYLKDKY